MLGDRLPHVVYGLVYMLQILVQSNLEKIWCHQTYTRILRESPTVDSLITSLRPGYDLMRRKVDVIPSFR